MKNVFRNEIIKKHYQNGERNKTSNLEYVPWTGQQKEYLTEMIKMSNIYICCMQKIDIPIGYNVSPHNNQ